MHSRTGFTVVELLVAMTAGCMVVLVASRLFSGAAEGVAKLSRERVALDREQNARRRLSALMGSIDPLSRGASAFSGSQEQLRFSAWDAHEFGWPRLGTYSLELRDSCVLLTGPVQTIPLTQQAHELDIDYLAHGGANEKWVREWISPTSLPLAVRLRIVGSARADTFLFAIGSRG